MKYNFERKMDFCDKAEKPSIETLINSRCPEMFKKIMKNLFGDN